MLKVDVAGGDERVDPAARCWGNRLGASLDVLLGRTGQSTDDRTVLSANLLGNPLHSGEIASAGEGKPSFDDIHAKPGQLLRNRQLFLQVETGPRRLLTIPEGGVENQDATWILGHNDAVSAGLVGMTMSYCILVQASRPKPDKFAASLGRLVT